MICALRSNFEQNYVEIRTPKACDKVLFQKSLQKRLETADVKPLKNWFTQLSSEIIHKFTIHTIYIFCLSLFLSHIKKR